MNDEDKRSEPREPKNTTASVEKAAADKWTALERAKTEKALPDSEEKYKLLFNSMDEGYCIIQILYDSSGKPCDFRYLEVNPAFERHNGLSGATGKTIRELTPAIESKWIDIYAQIAESGKSLRFVEDSDALHRIFDLYAFRIGKAEERKIAVLFIDITKRKKAEQFQRESEDRKTYLLRLSDALRSLSDLMEIKQEALRQAGNYLDLDRLMYSEPGAGLTSYTIYANYVRKGFALHTGRFAMDPLSPSGKSLQQGEIDIVCDVAKDKRLSAAEKETLFSLKVQAYVTVPLLRKGKWVCNLIAHSSHVHNWTSFEISILEETADRTWTELERARAKLALHDLNETLEQRVQERTRQLIELKLEQEKEKLNAVIFAQEEERTRIAEGLHNGVAQLLYAVQNKRRW